MNVTEIARRLAIPTRDLKELLPQFGFGIGRRAIKVDKRIAERILKQGALIRKAWEDKQHAAREAEKIVIPESVPKEIRISPETTVKEFAMTLHVPVTKLLAELMKNGIIATLNDRLDADTATIIAQDLGRTIVLEKKKDGDDGETPTPTLVHDSPETLTTIRPPVVVIMGHVDHGKTTLLDTIRKTNVIASEAGGITQHIGAYQVEKNGRTITFIDTPGHEAFTTMRSRGAKIADIAILVVAADDGVQPQTKEAANIIRGSGVPFVVALNKSDKPDANPEKTKKELSEIDIISEEWGGKTTIVPISAKTGDGVDQLLEMVLLTADLQKDKRKTDPARRAVATVIESHVDPGSGPRATVLIQLGTLRRGDIFGIRGVAYGKVRALRDWNDQDVAEAPPGMPVVLLGLKAAPGVGDIVQVPEDSEELEKFRGSVQRREKTTSIDRKKKEAHVGHVPLILRADVAGSLEAITLSLEKVSTADASVSIVSKGLGPVTENDVLHAEASGAVIVGFHVGPTPAARALAREKDVVIREYTVIYDLLGDVTKALEKGLVPEDIVVELGTMQVLARFREEQQWVIVGGKVLEGEILPQTKVRILRKGESIGEGFVTEVRVGKEIVTTVKKGEEAGVKITGMTDIQPHDVLQAFREEQRKRTLGT